MRETVITFVFLIINVSSIYADSVAKIGERLFATFDAAIAAVTNGDTIDLLSDIQLTLPQHVSSSDTIVIDGHGHTISNLKESCFYIHGSGEILFKNMIIVSSKYSIYNDGLNCSIKLQGVDISSSNRGIVYENTSKIISGSLFIEDCSISLREIPSDSTYNNYCSTDIKVRGISFYNVSHFNLNLKNTVIQGFQSSIYFATSPETSLTANKITAESCTFKSSCILTCNSSSNGEFTFNNCEGRGINLTKAVNSMFVCGGDGYHILRINGGNYTTLLEAEGVLNREYLLMLSSPVDNAFLTDVTYTTCKNSKGGIAQYLSASSVVDISGGAFVTDKASGESQTAGSIRIFSGEFRFDPSAYVKNDNVAVESHVNSGVWTVAPGGVVYKGNDIPITSENLISFSELNSDYPNAVMFVDSKNVKYANLYPNVIVDYSVGHGHYYECPNFILTDRSINAKSIDFYSPVDFIAVGGKYVRKIYDNSTSWCVPFGLSLKDFNNHDVKLLSFAFCEPVYNQVTADMFTRGDGAYAYFIRRDSIGPGIPFMMYSKSGGEWTKNFDNTLIVSTPENSTDMQGTFALTDYYQTGGYYGISDDGTKLVEAIKAPLWPFRSLIGLTYNETFNNASDSSSGSQNVRPAYLDIRIVGEDNDATTCIFTPSESKGLQTQQQTYRLDGRRAGYDDGGVLINKRKIIIRK